MEEKNNTSKYLNKIGCDEALITELNHALDREIEKSPDQIDVEKIDSIVGLLNQVDDIQNVVQEISKEQFIKRYLSESNIKISNKLYTIKQVKLKILKWTAYFVMALSLLNIGNFISVKMTGKNFLTIAKEKVHRRK